MGASGFLLKDTEPRQLHRGRSASIAAGDALLAPSVTRRLITEFATPARRCAVRGRPSSTRSPSASTRCSSSSPRGMSNDEIAQRLFISPTTAKTHVSHVMMKLGARDRAQLVVIAYESGVVVPRRALVSVETAAPGRRPLPPA